MLEHSHCMAKMRDLPRTVRARRALVRREVELRLGPAVATTYLQTKNFALGGLTPMALVATEQGTRQVLAEISAHAGEGPL